MMDLNHIIYKLETKIRDYQNQYRIDISNNYQMGAYNQTQTAYPNSVKHMCDRLLKVEKTY